MQVYIDKANASSLARSRRDDANLYDNCMKMLKYHSNLYFQFPKEDLKNDPDLLNWIRIFADGVKGEIKWSQPQIPTPRPLKFNFYSSFEQPEQFSSIYLVDDERAERIAQNGSLMISPVGQELKTLRGLLLTEDGQYIDTLNPSKMHGWQDIVPYISPLTDIILVDQYILSNPELYENNLYALIEQLCSFVKDETINIVIFTTPDNYNKVTKYTFTPNFNQIIQEIKQKTRRLIGRDARITFVLSKDLDEHDRTLFTNMKFYVSGDSFNYFGSHNNVITEGRWLHIHSLGSSQNMTASMDFINDMQKLIQRVQAKNNDQLILGNKTSHYLKF